MSGMLNATNPVLGTQEDGTDLRLLDAYDVELLLLEDQLRQKLAAAGLTFNDVVSTTQLAADTEPADSWVHLRARSNATTFVVCGADPAAIGVHDGTDVTRLPQPEPDDAGGWLAATNPAGWRIRGATHHVHAYDGELTVEFTPDADLDRLVALVYQFTQARRPN